MVDQFDIYSIYEQNLNFLIGAGASYGFLPTLALKIKDDRDNAFSFETLAKFLEDNKHENLYSLLFMYYYRRCIWTGLPRIPRIPFPPDRVQVLDQYKSFLKTLLAVIDRQESSSKKCNIYTTNYDSCFELAADDLLAERVMEFCVNDGSSGFQRRSFHTKNFNNRIYQKGIFDRHNTLLPQLNILHPHGSVYWRKVSEGIEVNYGHSDYDISFNGELLTLINGFGSLLEESKNNSENIKLFNENLPGHFSATEFWSAYKKIPIVNPTKWKFHETVFEEAYYQILRHLSFELERPNSVLITFGFSFADEHILHLVQRSLSNPSLTLYISCFNQAEEQAMREKFKGSKNVKYIGIDGELNFERFNEQVFTLEKSGKML